MLAQVPTSCISTNEPSETEKLHNAPLQTLPLPAHLLLLLLLPPLLPRLLVHFLPAALLVAPGHLRLVHLPLQPQPLHARQPRERHRARAVVERGPRAALARRRVRAHELGVERDHVRLQLVEQALDLALAARLLVLERIRLRAVEVGLAGARDEDAGETRGMSDGEDVLVGTEGDAGQWAVWDRMSEVERRS